MTLLAKYGKPVPPPKAREAGLGPVIDDAGNIRFLSVSQLEKFDSEVYGGCERRWWFRYKARQPEPQKGHQKLGDQAHAQLEHYLKTGEDVLGEIVRPGKRFLPAPGSDLLVEVKFGELAWPGPVLAPVVSALTAGGVPLTGKADLMHARGEWVDDDGVLHIEPDAAECVDHKTTKQIDSVVDPETGIITKQGYAKTAEQLADTWQMSGYGELAWQRWPKIKFARLGHAYYQTTGKRQASKRSILVPIDIVRGRWKKADNLVERMKAVAREQRAENVTANIDACGAYGGCPHKQKCPRDPKLALAAIFGANTAALLKKVADKSLSAPTASILDPSSSASSTAREEVKGMSLLAKRKAAPAGQPVPAAAPTVKPEVAQAMAALEAEEKAIKAGITPPDLPPPVKTAEPHAPESEFAKNIKVEASCGHTVSYEETSRLPDGTIKHIGCEGAVAPAFTPVPPTTSPLPSGACSVGGTQVELTIDEVASKKYACACGTGSLKIKPAKLGDGKYYALVPKHDTPFANQPKVETPAPAPSTPPPAPVAPTVTIKPDATIEVKEEAKAPAINPAYQIKSHIDERVDLYLDCAEDGIKLERLEKYADGLCQTLCEQYKAADVRCAPAESVLGFGKWRGALAALAKAQPPSAGSYACTSTSEIGLVVFEALATLNRGRVVRGAR